MSGCVTVEASTSSTEERKPRDKENKKHKFSLSASLSFIRLVFVLMISQIFR